MKQNVLVTGSAGRIGRAVAEELTRRGHFVRGFDLAPSVHATESVTGTITDQAAIDRSARGMNVIIHLAAVPDDDDFMTKLLPNNIAPVHHVLESARANDIKRVILASSGQVNWFRHFDGPFPIRTTDPLEPRYWYAVTKVFAEYAGMIFAKTHGMDVLAVRLGACPRDQAAVEYIGQSEIVRDVYLSPGDAGRFFAQAVEAPPGFGFQPLYACSKWVKREVFDLTPSRQLIGYEPRDQWPEGIPAEIAVNVFQSHPRA